MTIEHITIEQIADRDGSFLYSDPGTLGADVVQTSDRRDVLTPFRTGKSWTFELMRDTQPFTWKALATGSNLWLERFVKPNIETRALLLVVNGMVVEICRGLYGSNPSDPNYQEEIENWNRYLTKRFGKPTVFKPRVLSLPEPIRLAYYTRIDGLNLPRQLPLGTQNRLLPLSTIHWNSVDLFLRQLRLKNKYLSLVEDMIPGIRPKRKADPYVNFMMFLDARPDQWGEGDVFFVKNHVQDGTIYYIRDGDVPNMMTLADAPTAIDRYCAHVLAGNDARFDFMPYAIPFA